MLALSSPRLESSAVGVGGRTASPAIEPGGAARRSARRKFESNQGLPRASCPGGQAGGSRLTTVFNPVSHVSASGGGSTASGISPADLSEVVRTATVHA